MLRVGLTGGLGSGKSTVARMLGEHGAHVLSADALGRELMEPGTAVFAAIVERFGAGVVAEGRLDRAALAGIAFAGGRVEELNAIVHPATIARQAELSEEIFSGEPRAVVVVESALIFETKYSDAADAAPWRSRFDRLILVTAPEDVKVERFVRRSLAGDAVADWEELAAEARRRLARMLPDAVKASQCDYVVENGGTVGELQGQVDRLWAVLAAQR